MARLATYALSEDGGELRITVTDEDGHEITHTVPVDHEHLIVLTQALIVACERLGLDFTRGPSPEGDDDHSQSRSR